MEEGKKYYAFISYSHKDEEWAKWLQYEFEHYHLPTTLNGLQNVPTKFRPIFRDVDELSGGELKPQISKALSLSANLVIICSPSSAKSPYVNEEIQEFIELGERNGVNNISNIFPFIVEGVPHSGNDDNECFPKVLRNLPTELIGGDVTKHGREHAFVKILAGTLQNSHIDFSMLWNQFERDRIEEERRKREEQNKLWSFQSRFLAEKMDELTKDDNSCLACMLGLHALPSNLDDPNDRPYCPEVEVALRKAIKSLSFRIDTSSSVVSSKNGEYIAACRADGIYVFRVNDGATIRVFKKNYGWVSNILFSDNSRYLIVSYDHFWEKDYIEIYDITQNKIKSTIKEASSPFCISKDNKLIAYLHFTWRAVCLSNIDGSDAIFLDYYRKDDNYISMSFSDDGKYLLYSNSKCIKLLCVASRIRVREFDGLTSPILKTLICPDGKTIVSISINSELNLWDIDSGKLKKSVIIEDNDIVDACFNFEGKLCITNRNFQRTYYNLNDLQSVDYDVIPSNILLCLGKETLYAFDKQENGWKIRLSKNITNIISKIKHSGFLKYAMFLPNGTHVICAFENQQIRIWEISSNQWKILDIGISYKTKLAEISNDARYIGIVTIDNVVMVWDTLKEKVKSSIREENKVTSISISPDSNNILVGLVNGDIHIWDICTSNLIYDNSVSCYYCHHVIYNHDASLISISTSEGLYLIDLLDNIINKLNAKENTDLLKNNSHVFSKFSSDGAFIATAVGSSYDLKSKLVLWNSFDSKIMYELLQDDDVNFIDFSADCRYFVYSVKGHSFTICDVLRGTTIIKHTVHEKDITNTIKSVRFSSSGREILVAMRYGDLYIYEFKPLQDIIDELKIRFKHRELTVEEKREFYVD